MAGGGVGDPALGQAPDRVGGRARREPRRATRRPRGRPGAAAGAARTRRGRTARRAGAGPRSRPGRSRRGSAPRRRAWGGTAVTADRRRGFGRGARGTSPARRGASRSESRSSVTITSVATMPTAGTPARCRASTIAAATRAAVVSGRSWIMAASRLGRRRRAWRRRWPVPTCPPDTGRAGAGLAQNSSTGSRIFQDSSTSSWRGKSGASPIRTSRMSRSYASGLDSRNDSP